MSANQVEAIGAYFDDLCRRVGFLHTHFFPDVYFQSEALHRPLSVEVEALCDSVRLRLDEPAILNLKAVRLIEEDAEGLERAIGQVREAAVSSTWNDNRLDVTALLHFESPNLNLHTGPGMSWLTLGFAPTRLMRIDVSNRDDEYATRAWSLCIDTGSEGEWTTVYRHRSREEAFLALVRNSRPRYPDRALDGEMMRLCIVALRDPYTLNLNLKRLRDQFSAEIETALRAGVNAHLLGARELQLTAHGVSRTFRFWKESEKADYLAEAARLIDSINRWKYLGFLTYGALLGFVRGGSLIPHDDDVDVSVVFTDTDLGFADHREKFETQLVANGYRIQERHPGHTLVVSANDKPIDIFFAERHGDSILFRPGSKQPVTLDDIAPLSVVSMNGVPLRIPRNPFAVLESIYGPGWRTPRVEYTHVNWR